MREKEEKTNLLEMYASAIDLTGCDILTEYFFVDYVIFLLFLRQLLFVRPQNFCFSSMKKVFPDKFHIVSADAVRSKH